MILEPPTITKPRLEPAEEQLAIVLAKVARRYKLRFKTKSKHHSAKRKPKRNE